MHTTTITWPGKLIILIIVSKLFKFQYHLDIFILLNPHCDLLQPIFNRLFDQLIKLFISIPTILLQLIIYPYPFDYLPITINKIPSTLFKTLNKPSFELSSITINNLALSLIPIFIKLSNIFVILRIYIIAISMLFMLTPLSDIFGSISKHLLPIAIMIIIRPCSYIFWSIYTDILSIAIHNIISEPPFICITTSSLIYLDLVSLAIHRIISELSLVI